MLLCKLHNEVFAVAETRINTKCSLTVCEGVSYSLTSSTSSLIVPSLYVRVYRVPENIAFSSCGSLTVCEGVS